ncbi:cytochrome P450 [Schizophyllum commune Loenen D]|nr:cytochrome P450 [Schizophyllum commune Loenen D]
MLLLVQDILAVVLAYVLYLRLKQASGPPLPPGPPADPLIGHFRINPQHNAERVYLRWSKELKSDEIHLNILGQRLLVLNSLRAAVDLLEKRGATYSDRPKFPFFEMIGWYEDLLLVGSSDPSFSALRGIFQIYFAKSTIQQKFGTLQANEARKLVKRIAEEPVKWREYLLMYGTAITIQIITGHEIKSLDDVYLRVAEDVGKAMTGSGTPGATGVDFCPWLRYLPSWCDPTGSSAFARKWRFAIENLYNVPYERVEADIEAGTAQPSFILSAMQEMQSQGEGEKTLTPERIKGVCAATYAGNIYTADAIAIFIFAIVNCPEVQARAQAELDAIVGPDRLPDLADRMNLPYIERIMQETFRFWPTSPLGAPHKSTEDDVHRGMFIPKGSLVLFNAFAISHNEAVYADPWRFDPDRYLPREEGGRGEPLQIAHFGFGRRICPGRFLGEASVFIGIATLLHVFRFNKAKDASGDEITVNPEDAEYISGTASHPEKILCTITPASEEKRCLATGQ